jgi:hypothetical protein
LQTQWAQQQKKTPQQQQAAEEAQQPPPAEPYAGIRRTQTTRS